MAVTLLMLRNRVVVYTCTNNSVMGLYKFYCIATATLPSRLSSNFQCSTGIFIFLRVRRKYYVINVQKRRAQAVGQIIFLKVGLYLCNLDNCNVISNHTVGLYFKKIEE